MERIGDFEYNKRDLIGHGAFAVVFKGRHAKKHDFVVAIKSITKKNLAKSQNLLSKEIKILKELSDLHHENVVALLDCKETTHHVYLVMEYCNAGDLADYLQAKGTLSEDTISSFLRQIAAAMKALNDKGIVHRDMKPQNILLCHPEGKPSSPPNEMKLKIADFGFARFLQDGVMAATLCGSPMYMAPEVIMSLQYDAKADLWSIGTIVFQCLTGKAPFQAQTPQQLKAFYEKNANLAPNIPSSTSPELRDLLMKLLKRNAKDRIDFDEFFHHPFCAQLPSPLASSPVPVPNRPRRPSSDSPTLKTVHASPLSGNVPYSPSAPDLQRVREQLAQEEAVSASPQEGEFIKVDHLSQSPAEDFVLVPENISSDTSDTSSVDSHKNKNGRRGSPKSSDSQTSNLPAHKVLKVDPSTGAVAYKKPSPEGSPEQTSPSRPSTLPVQSPSSQPLPVPTQVEAYQQIQRNSPGSPEKPRMRDAATVMSPQRELSSAVPIPRRNSSETKLLRTGSVPSLGSMSPPSVQFTIGTPPNPWRRSSAETPPPIKGTPPSSSSSPLRKSVTTPPRVIKATSNSPQFSGPSSLPTIAGSPNKYMISPTRHMTSPTRHMTSPTRHMSVDNYGNYSTSPPSSALRNRTVPDMFGMGNHEVYYPPRPIDSHMRSNTEPANLPQRNDSAPRLSDQLLNRGGSSRLSEQLLRAAFGSNPAQASQPAQGVVVPYDQNRPTARERRDSYGRERSESFTRTGSFNAFRSGSFTETSPPTSNIPYAQSPPNMEGHITFVAPGLAEETLMDDDHNDTVAKLQFVLAVVETVKELAQTRSTPLTESVSRKDNIEQVKFLTESQRRMEQLVLYAHALHLLSAALNLAKDEIKGGRLQPSNNVRNILRELNCHFQMSFAQCKQLKNQGINENEARNASVSADRLIYNYAIEMCQTAALDEMFGNPHECFRRYKNAQILLHTLAQQAQHIKDKELLKRYQDSVEKRLFNLQSQGLVIAYDSS